MSNAPASAAPRIAVIVPAYGVAHLLGEALDSLLEQTFQDWECVVVDDGAPDDVASAVAPYISDPRIQFLATDNRGVSTARNRAIAETSAPYVALLDGDDRFLPQYLARNVAVLDAHPDARIVTCNAMIFGAVARPYLCFKNQQGTLEGACGSLGDVLDRSFGVYIGSSFRRADFDAVGGFDESMTHAEDLDLWVRLMMLGGSVRYLDEVLGEYRVRESSASASTQRMLQGNMRVYEKAIKQMSASHPRERDIAQAMLEANRRALNIEQAVDQVLDGGVASGLAELRSYNALAGKRWAMAWTLWRFWPASARPMLLWRRYLHRRGNRAGIADFIKTFRKPSGAIS